MALALTEGDGKDVNEEEAMPLALPGSTGNVTASVSLTVTEKDFKFKITSDISECSKEDFTFDIVPEGSNQQVGYIRVRKNGQIIREKKTNPFPAGIVIPKKKIKLQGGYCIMKFKIEQ